ncbi:hypothetical protein CJU89_2435 [Yarrowia sp. B02]|nr:hypothetical protein CJU89_2435 [Yarrowia sp. B02]
MNRAVSTSLVLPTPDTTLEGEESDVVDASNKDTEEYMFSMNFPNPELPPINVEDSFAKTASPTPSPTLPSLTQVLGDIIPQTEFREESFSSQRSDIQESFNQSEVQESFSSRSDVQESFNQSEVQESSDEYSPSESDSNYSPFVNSSPEASYRSVHSTPYKSAYNSVNSSPEAIYTRDSTGAICTPQKPAPKYVPSSSYSSLEYSGSSCVAELKSRGLWEEAQKKKRGKLSCSECGKFKIMEKYDHLADLAKHMDNEHADLSHRLKCPHQGCAWGVIGFVSLTEQKRHIKHQHENKPIECKICFRKLQRQDGYIRHMRDVHGVSHSSKEKLPHRKTKVKK